MTRFILRGLYHGFIAVLLFLAYTGSLTAATEITATVQGQACVDTAVARGWLAPIKYKPTMKITTEKQ